MSNYIFDLDGTLIDSSEEVLLCLKKAFLQSNYPVNAKNLTNNVIGPPLLEIIKLIAPELEDVEKINEIISNFREIYDNNSNDKSKVYPNVYQTLDCLKTKKHRLFLATLKPQKPTLRIIKQYNLNYFEEIYSIDKFGENITKEEMIKRIVEKYHLVKAQTYMIGDAVTDMTSAKKAGVNAIGALWGYGDNKEQLKENSDIVLESIEQICQK